MDELTDHVDDVSDATGNYAAMLRERFAKQLRGPGPDLAHTGTPDVPVIVEKSSHGEGIGAHDLVSNFVLVAAVTIKAGELVADKLTAKFKEKPSEHG